MSGGASSPDLILKSALDDGKEFRTLHELHSEASGHRTKEELVFPIPPVSFLDPRPSSEADAAPIEDAVNIPLTELSARTAELPPRSKVVRVVGPLDLAAQTVGWLKDHGRNAIQVTKFESATAKVHGRLWEPNEWLFTFLFQWTATGRTPGYVLDLGCGGGRDAVYLAAHNWRVLAVDDLPDAIERGRNLAAHYLDTKSQALIEWQVADVMSDAYSPSRQFDLVASFFLFDRQLVARSKTWLVPRGILLTEAFTTVRQQEVGKPVSPERVVEPGEMQELLDDMEIVKLEEGEHPHGHTARAWAIRPG